MNTEPRNYSFNTEAAKKLGVSESIILQYISYWVSKNAMGSSSKQKDGHFWTYGSVRHISNSYPFWTDKQVRRILLSLEHKGAIKVGCYNKKGYDKTKWYTLTKLGESLCPYKEAFDQKGKPIPIHKNIDNKNKKIFEIPEIQPITK